MASTRKPDFWEGFEAIKDRNWTIQKKWPMLWDLGVIDLASLFHEDLAVGQKLFEVKKILQKAPKQKDSPLKLSPVTKTDAWRSVVCFCKKPLRNLNRHALANAWLVECWNDGLRKTRFKKKNNNPRTSEVRKFPLKLIQPKGVASSTCGSKGIFLFFETSTVKDWNEILSSNHFFVGDVF